MKFTKDAERIAEMYDSLNDICLRVRTFDSVDLEIIRVQVGNSKEALCKKALVLRRAVLHVLDKEIRADNEAANEEFTAIFNRVQQKPATPEEMVSLRQFCDSVPQKLSGLSDTLRGIQVCLLHGISVALNTA